MPLLVPISTHEGKIIDGRNRYRACMEAGVKPRFIEFDGSVPLINFVLSLNLRRRRLSESQRAMVAARVATLQKGSNQHTPIGGTSQSEASKLLNVSERSVQRATKVQDTGTPELIQAVESGNLAVTAALVEIATRLLRR